jgi:hypothetical protein
LFDGYFGKVPNDADISIPVVDNHSLTKPFVVFLGILPARCNNSPGTGGVNRRTYLGPYVNSTVISQLF